MKHVVRHVQESGPVGENTSAILNIDSTPAKAVSEEFGASSEESD